jgi:hypothetical protein
MAIAEDKAQELCSKSEWETVVTSFPPRLESLSAATLKKQANRIRRFLDKEKAQPGAEGRLALFEEALARLEAGRTAEESKEKLSARREKEKAAREREKSLRERRNEVRTRLQEKAEKEKAEKEGPPKDDDGAKKSGPQGVRKHLQAAAQSGKKTGMRKV